MERAFAELVRRLHDRYELVVYAADLAADLRHLVVWRRIPVPRRPAPLRFACFYALAGLRLAGDRATLVHTLGAIVPNRAHLATVQFCHAGFRDAVRGLAPPGAPVLRRLNTSLARSLCLVAERWSYRRGRTRVLAAVSAGIETELSRHYPDVPTVVAPNGVDRERFRPDQRARDAVRTELGIGRRDVLALFVGGDWDRKGLALVIEAVGCARSRSGRPISLAVVGRGDEERFRRIAERHGVADVIRFVPPCVEVERFYAAADLFAFPTMYEAFPLVALEAAAAGIPIVAPRVNGVEDLLRAGDAGILVDRDAQAIAGALARLAENPSLRARLGRGARERSAEYTWERVIAPIADTYDELAASDPRRG